VRIVSERRLRSLALRVAEGVRAAGAEPSVPRLARAGPHDWSVGGPEVPGDAVPEAVIVGSEDEREAIEIDRPDLVGRIWVASDPEETGRSLAGRLRPPPASRSAKIGVVGYNLKFFRPIAEHLQRVPNFDVRVAEWPKYAVNDVDATDAVIDVADIVVAEWCGPNAVYASRNKRPGQRLIIRLHRFELERNDWADVDIDAVDVVVTVGPHYRRRLLDTTGWPEGKVIVVPNAVDAAQLDRPKHDGADKAIGLLGAVPWRKRPDRALSILDELGPPWRLRIKSVHPSSERWAWDDDGYRLRYERVLDEIAVRGDIDWEDASPLVAQWFRHVGTILSVSDDESFHLAPAEGMASGTLPVIWDWPGAADIYQPHRLVTSVAEARAMAVERPREDDVRSEVERFDVENVHRRWTGLLVGEPPTEP
jgi:glycosyltransferase involved in cell wall biosynthesis